MYTVASGLDEGLWIAGKFVGCEIYGHCQKFPCPDSRVRFQKNHDFGLTLKRNPSFYYLILYRHPLASIMSLYELDCNSGSIRNDSYKTWQAFLADKLRYYYSFMDKWVISGPNKNTFILQYELFIDDFKSHILKILKFIEPCEEIDLNWLDVVIESNSVGLRREIKEFKYYRDDLVHFVESDKDFKKIKPYLNQCL